MFKRREGICLSLYYPNFPHLFVCWDWISLCRPAYHKTCSVGQPALNFQRSACLCLSYRIKSVGFYAQVAFFRRFILFMVMCMYMSECLPRVRTLATLELDLAAWVVAKFLLRTAPPPNHWDIPAALLLIGERCRWFRVLLFCFETGSFSIAHTGVRFPRIFLLQPPECCCFGHTD